MEALVHDEIERIERGRVFLLDFTTYTKPNYLINWHHRFVAKKLDEWIEGKIKRLMVFEPPRHGKSEQVSRRVPALIFGKKPDAQIIGASYGDALAGRMNRDIQRIIDSREYAQLFPETRLNRSNVRTAAQGNWLRNSDLFEIVKHGGVYRGAGVGGGITGMGANYGIIDDPYKDGQQANSKTYRERVWEWYWDTFYQRLEGEAQILITLTRWHEDDLAGRLLREAKNNPEADQWEVVCLPGICEEEGRPGDPRKVGEALWPEKRSAQALLKIKAANPRVFNALIQQRPSAQEGNIFKRADFKFYERLPRDLDEVIQTWDLAVKAKTKNDWVAGQVWGRKGPNIFLMYRVKIKAGLKKSLAEILRTTEEFEQAKKKLIEDKANGSPAVELLVDEMPGVIPWPVSDNLEERALAQNYWVESGNVYLPDPKINSGTSEFIEECVSFPNAAHDDEVSAFTIALEYFGKKGGSSIERLEKFLGIR